MTVLKHSVLALLSLHCLSIWAASEPAAADGTDDSSSKGPPQLAVQASVSFPQSEIFGVKLVNGHATQSVLSVVNNEEDPITVAMVGGSLWTISGNPPQNLRNLTTVKYNVEIAGGKMESLPYSFSTELQPEELRLNLAALVQDHNGAVYTLQAYNETVTVVEPETSIFDPQIIFLYLFLLAVFGGTIYFIYTTWITTLFPAKRNPSRTKKTSKKGLESIDGISSGGEAQTTAVSSTGAAKYDESWIPEHHIKRPDARRVKSGSATPKVKSKKADS